MPPAARAGRPLSPHLQIWRWTPTMASSITHRATGVALYGGALLLAVWFAALAAGPAAYAPVGALVGSLPGIIVVFGFAWALIFHALNGVRHLYWDTGRGLDPKTATRTSIFVFGLSFVLTLIVAAAGRAGAAA